MFGFLSFLHTFQFLFLIYSFPPFCLFIPFFTRWSYIYLQVSTCTVSKIHEFLVLNFGTALVLLLLRYKSDRVLAFSTIAFHLRRFWTCSVHFTSFTFFKSFLKSSSHRDLGLPTGLLVNGFHLYIFFTILISGILFTAIVLVLQVVEMAKTFN